jgi:hypothetical protein
MRTIEAKNDKKSYKVTDVSRCHKVKRRYKDMTGFRNHTKIGNRVQDRQQIPNRLQRSEEVTEVRRGD